MGSQNNEHEQAAVLSTVSELRGVVLADAATERIAAVSKPIRQWLEREQRSLPSTLSELLALLDVLQRDGDSPRIRVDTSELSETAQRVLTITVDHSRSGGQGPKDPLTGLALRETLRCAFEAWKREPEPNRRPCALLFVDLDDFKQVNDRLGHIAGDAVLREVATRLAGAIREGDLVVRYGGDEFAVLVRDVAEKAVLDVITNRLKRQIASPLELGDDVLSVSVSVGLAIAADASADLDDLLHQADRAMYAAKRTAEAVKVRPR